jgi:hypothetical protein
MDVRMRQTTILVLGLATALLHLYLNKVLGGFSLLFTLNGLGYLAFLAAISFNLPILEKFRRQILVLFLLYTLVTILAWVAIGQRDVLAYLDKAIEVILVIFLGIEIRGSRSNANAG